MRRDRSWGGKHAAGRRGAGAGRAGSQDRPFPAAGGAGGLCRRGVRGAGPGSCGRGGGATVPGARSRGRGPATPRARVRGPQPRAQRLRWRPLPARQAWRRAARKTRAGAGRGRGRGGAKTWSGPRAPKARPPQGPLRGLAPGLRRGARGTRPVWDARRASEEGRPVRAQPAPPLPGTCGSLADLHHFWKSPVSQTFMK